MLKDFHAFQLAKQLHWSCRTLRIPKYLMEQLHRASSSVALNVAEGSGKRTPAEQRRFYGIALGSLRECEAIIELERIEQAELVEIIRHLGSILFKLSRLPENRTFNPTER